MLKANSKRQRQLPRGHIAIVAACYNRKYVDGMLKAALKELEAAKVGPIETYRVPGSFEIPVVVSRLLHREQNRPEAILCLGVIIQGETAHADHIGTAITNALMDLQVWAGTPVVHEVLQVRDEKQAAARCLDPKRNRGAEAAQTAIEMARLLRGKPFGDPVGPC